MKSLPENCIYSIVNNRTGKEIKLAMQSLWLTGEIMPFGAKLFVRHDFQTAEKHPVEAVYCFMLPRDGAVRSFRVKGQGFTMDAELKAKKEALSVYEKGIKNGHLSVLSREYSDGMVNLNVGNIKPGETVSVVLEIIAGVDTSDTGFRFRFPFAVAPSYHSQASYLQTSPGTGEILLPEDKFEDLLLPAYFNDAAGLHKIGFDLVVHLPEEINTVSSPSHHIACKKLDSSRFLVSLSTAEDVPNRDLVLDVSSDQSFFMTSAGADSTGRISFAAMLPSALFGEKTDGPRQVVFLLDRSGSMGGLPIKQAKRSIEACIGCLSDQDRFSCIAFDDALAYFDKNLVKVDNENRSALKNFLNRIDARGGTQLLKGLKAAAELLGSSGGDILLITDGQVFESETILQYLSRLNLRVHCLGIGSASQDRCLSLMAKQTKAQYRFLTPRERIDSAAIGLFSSIGSPVAAGVSVDIEGAKTGQIEPEAADLVFEDRSLIVMGSFEAGIPAALTVNWINNNRKQSRTFPLNVSTAVSGETLRVFRGAAIVAGLQIAAQNVRQKKRLCDTCREYGLSSREMPLVAVVKRKGDQGGKTPETVVVPVGMPGDVDFEAYFPHRSRHYRSLVSCFEPSVMNCSIPDLDCSYKSDSMSQKSLRSIKSDFSSSENYDIPDLDCSYKSDSMPQDFMRSIKDEPVNSDEECLVLLAGLIEADGGLPGRDMQTRMIHSLTALLCFAAGGSSEQQGIYRQHVKRLCGFMDQAAVTETVTEPLKAIIVRVMRLITECRIIQEDYFDLADKIIHSKKNPLTALLKKLEKEEARIGI